MSSAVVRYGFLFSALLGSMGTSWAQETGLKGFLHRTASAIAGTPASASPGAINTASNGLITGPTTTGPVYRPISPASGGQFPGIFDGYSIAKNAPRGHYPRVALTAEVYGGGQACWTFRATLWQSPTSHRDERFELCNAPMTTKDDLGEPVEVIDPTFALMGVITGHHTMPSSNVEITTQRTTGPNPVDIPFAVQVNMSTPAARAMVSQYDHMIARAMLISGYAPPSQMIGGNGLRQAGTVGSDNRLMWFAGFAPGGNRDTAATSNLGR